MSRPVNMFWVGTVCKICRRRAGKTVAEMARETDYSLSNIYAFENGRNNNIVLLMWYFEHTDLAPWMLYNTNPFDCKIDRLNAWLDDMHNYRRDMLGGASR